MNSTVLNTYIANRVLAFEVINADVVAPTLPPKLRLNKRFTTAQHIARKKWRRQLCRVYRHLDNTAELPTDPTTRAWLWKQVNDADTPKRDCILTWSPEIAQEWKEFYYKYVSLVRNQTKRDVFEANMTELTCHVKRCRRMPTTNTDDALERHLAAFWTTIKSGEFVTS